MTLEYHHSATTHTTEHIDITETHTHTIVGTAILRNADELLSQIPGELISQHAYATMQQPAYRQTTATQTEAPQAPVQWRLLQFEWVYARHQFNNNPSEDANTLSTYQTLNNHDPLCEHKSSDSDKFSNAPILAGAHEPLNVHKSLNDHVISALDTAVHSDDTHLSSTAEAALHHVIQHCFTSLHTTALWTTVAPDHIWQQRIYIACGFRLHHIDNADMLVFVLPIQAWQGMQEDATFSQRVYRAVCDIPYGYVATYGQIAALAGSPRASRIVGGTLHRNPQPGVIPCHRVVFKNGAPAPGFAFGGPDIQRILLEDEGVHFIRQSEQHTSSGWASDWVVDLDHYQWRG